MQGNFSFHERNCRNFQDRVASLIVPALMYIQPWIKENNVENFKEGKMKQIIIITIILLQYF